ncbi:MAG: hypothetical protein GKR87_13710 [Kiritimatiellae bacterium]|nr:hypothetical protein [Kiritimatiellia bacterium]
MHPKGNTKKMLLDKGIKPFKIDALDVPVVNAESIAELAKELAPIYETWVTSEILTPKQSLETSDDDSGESENAKSTVFSVEPEKVSAVSQRETTRTDRRRVLGLVEESSSKRTAGRGPGAKAESIEKVQGCKANVVVLLLLVFGGVLFIAVIYGAYYVSYKKREP